MFLTVDYCVVAGSKRQFDDLMTQENLFQDPKDRGNRVRTKKYVYEKRVFEHSAFNALISNTSIG